MLPDRCTVKEDGKACVNPPKFIISVIVDSGEYMIGVTCGRHRVGVSDKIRSLQLAGKIIAGEINFELIKSVGTDCVKGNSDDFIQIG